MINSLHVCRLCISKVIQITEAVFSPALLFLRFDLFLMSQDLARSEIRLDYLVVNICDLCEGTVHFGTYADSEFVFYSCGWRTC